MSHLFLSMSEEAELQRRQSFFYNLNCWLVFIVLIFSYVAVVAYFCFFYKIPVCLTPAGQ